MARGAAALVAVAVWIAPAGVPVAAAASTPHPSTPHATAQPAATPGAAGSTQPSAVGKRIESLLVARSAYRALAKHDPAAFAAIVEAVERSPQSGAGDEVVLAVARGYLSPIAFRSMAHATDTTAEDFARNLALEIRIAGKKEGDACFAVLGPDADAAVRITKVDLGTLDDFDLDRIAEAIEKTATQPNPVPTHDDVARAFDPIASGIGRRYGDDANLLERLDQPGIDKPKACKIAVDYISLTLSRQDSKAAGKVMRYLLSTFDAAGAGGKAR